MRRRRVPMGRSCWASLGLLGMLLFLLICGKNIRLLLLSIALFNSKISGSTNKVSKLTLKILETFLRRKYLWIFSKNQISAKSKMSNFAHRSKNKEKKHWSYKNRNKKWTKKNKTQIQIQMITQNHLHLPLPQRSKKKIRQKQIFFNSLSRYKLRFLLF